MKRFLMFAMVAMIFVPAASGHPQWTFPKRVGSRRTQAAPQEAPRPVLKQRDGTPVAYTEVQAPANFTVPAGTRVLTSLASPLHTTSSGTGSGVYVEVQQPVIVGNRVVIPQGSKVQGTVVGDKRPGRIKGRAQFHFRFEQLILPDNRVLPIEGRLLSFRVQHATDELVEMERLLQSTRSTKTSPRSQLVRVVGRWEGC
jgi:hypothetical protein